MKDVIRELLTYFMTISVIYLSFLSICHGYSDFSRKNGCETGREDIVTSERGARGEEAKGREGGKGEEGEQEERKQRGERGARGAEANGMEWEHEERR